MSVDFSKHAKPYVAKSAFHSVLFFQTLIANDPLGQWSSIFKDTEIRFIYDMVSSANSYRNFTLTTAQSQWLVKLMCQIKDRFPVNLHVEQPKSTLSTTTNRKKHKKKTSALANEALPTTSTASRQKKAKRQNVPQPI